MNARHANGTSVLVDYNNFRSWGRVVERLASGNYRVAFAPGEGQAVGHHIITPEMIVGTGSQAFWTLPTPGYKH